MKNFLQQQARIDSPFFAAFFITGCATMIVIGSAVILNNALV